MSDSRVIYFILPDLSAGGAERVSITIARLLKKAGKDVRFLNLGLPYGEMYDWIQPEFELTSFGCKRVLMAIPQLKCFMKKHSCALFFSSREHVNIVGLICSKLANREIVVRIPNMPKNDLVKGIPGLKMFIIKFINKYLLGKAKCVIAQNEEMEQQLIDFYGLSKDKIVAINNPIDKEFVINSAKNTDTPFHPGEFNILNVSNISYAKGIDILLTAWTKVKKTIPQAHLYLVGRNNSEYAQQIISTLKQRDDISFIGFQSNPYKYMKYCDVFVLASRMEGFPNVVLEAMCFNRPIASTTCVDVIKDIVKPGVNGYYCDIENPGALADIIIKASKLQNIDNNYSLFDEDKLLNVFK